MRLCQQNYFSYDNNELLLLYLQVEMSWVSSNGDTFIGCCRCGANYLIDN